MPDRSPLYEARHSPRYERQKLIRRYEEEYKCRLVILIDALFSHSVTLLEETLHDADSAEDLHIILATPGGDGETAIRLIRQAQSRCSRLIVIVPDQAKSAGTVFVLGADQICMGPTSCSSKSGTWTGGIRFGDPEIHVTGRRIRTGNALWVVREVDSASPRADIEGRFRSWLDDKRLYPFQDAIVALASRRQLLGNPGVGRGMVHDGATLRIQACRKPQR